MSLGDGDSSYNSRPSTYKQSLHIQESDDMRMESGHGGEEKFSAHQSEASNYGPRVHCLGADLSYQN